MKTVSSCSRTACRAAPRAREPGNPLTSRRCPGAAPRRRADWPHSPAEAEVGTDPVPTPTTRPRPVSGRAARAGVPTPPSGSMLPGDRSRARCCAPAGAGAVGLIITEPLNYPSATRPHGISLRALPNRARRSGRVCCWWRWVPTRQGSDAIGAAGLAAGSTGLVVIRLRRRPVSARGAATAATRGRGRPAPGRARASRVGIDDRAAMGGLAEHVVELGHREIGRATMRSARLAARRAPARGRGSRAHPDAALPRPDTHRVSTTR